MSCDLLAGPSMAQVAPPANIAELLVSKASTASKATMFKEVLQRSKHKDFITSGSFTGTLLVPTDVAFDRLLAELTSTKAEFLAETGGLLDVLVLYHCIPNVIVKNASEFLVSSNMSTLLAGTGNTIVGKAGNGSGVALTGYMNTAAVLEPVPSLVTVQSVSGWHYSGGLELL
jgi:hypothetical protein